MIIDVLVVELSSERLRMDYLKTLAVFVRVAEKDSFAAVAEEFGVSGTMVGKHVQALERRLGGRLVARTTRRQSLTDLGVEFYERARSILAVVESADGLAEEMRSQPRGTLRVSAPTALGAELLVDAMADYRRKVLGDRVDEMEFDERLAVTLEISALQYFPFLIAEVMASNIGGAATLIGDPPNIIIASRSGLSFNDFLVNMGPIV
ncbi:MAG: LysR family transcriptional regulator, partial [Acidihalobacter sp.]